MNGEDLNVGRGSLAFSILLFWLSSNSMSALAGASSQQGEAKRPNILWIVGENFDLDFGCFGESLVATPNVDRLEKARVAWVGEEWHPQIATPQNVQPPPYYPDHPIVRQEWARY